MNRIKPFKPFMIVMLLALLTGFAGCGDSDQAPATEQDVPIPAVTNGLVYQSEIPQDRIDAMNESVSSLFAAPLNINTQESSRLLDIMQIQDLQPSLMQAWLEARVKYVVNDDFDLTSHTLKTESHQFPEPDAIPPGFRPIFGDQMADDEVQVVMSNIGTQLYLEGKQKSTMRTLDFGDGLPVPLISPRIGLLMIGPGLFPPMNNQIQNIALDIFRVSTLFHEARHSDGHGETTGFLHVICPESVQPYAGLPACDSMKNGAYTVGALVLKTLTDNCGECSTRSKKWLENMYLDVASRMLKDPSDVMLADAKTPVAADWDDAPEGARPTVNSPVNSSVNP